MTTEVAVQDNTPMNLISGTNIEQVSQQLQAIDHFQTIVQQTLHSGQDFGVIPGTNKPTLLKPGAEKILMLMGLTSEYEIVDKVEDYQNGFFAYTIKSSLRKNGQLITEGFGSANTKENRYQLKEWDDTERKKVWKGLYQDPFTLNNTVLKMAKKRAQVDAALTVGSLSNVFTQDIEDMKDFIQNEQVETMNNSDATSIVVTFGKHKGKTLGQIADEDRGYLKYLVEKAKDEPVRKAAEMLLHPPKQTKEKPPTTEPKQQVTAITQAQIDEINALASVVGAEKGFTAEEVIKFYKIADLAKINEETAKDLIKRLNKKLEASMQAAEPEEPAATETDLFDQSKEVDISDDDLPF